MVPPTVQSEQPWIPVDICHFRNTHPTEIRMARVQEYISAPGPRDVGGHLKGQGSPRFNPVAPDVPGSRWVGPIRVVGLVKDPHGATTR